LSIYLLTRYHQLITDFGIDIIKINLSHIGYLELMGDVSKERVIE